MVVNDDSGIQTPRSAQTFLASKLAPAQVDQS